MKTGDASAEAHEKEKAAAEKRREESGKAFRFFLRGKNESADLIFVDGEVNKKGFLTPPRVYEHMVNFGGKWHNLICPEQTDPQAGGKCPICEGKDRPSLVSFFTVIDLRPYKRNNGDVIPFTRKLYVAKPTTFEVLNKYAVALDGSLVGQRFTVSRTSDKAAAVGDVFIPTKKLTDLEAVRKQFTVAVKYSEKGAEKTKTVCLFEPLDYEKELVFRTGEQLRQMGFGSPASSVPQSQPPEGGGDVSDYEQHL